ncbi:histidine kinase group protein [Beauveria brongniartii RCEF 3172]|uniref:Histidine kinase group protein n=1 Tax=Beauveria brongniartii RCEF 3172 TaxID=1081107 RepID=A0A162LYY1_9HYPO|nr:histidine kinase group protein [Beauveria brongniartii RCEF 3172]
MNAFLGKRDDAIQDLGEAITRYTYATSRAQHSETQCEKIPDEKGPDEKVSDQPKSGETTRQRAPRRKVLECDKPDSLLGQLHFHRGSISLQMAYHHVSNSFAPEGHASETQSTSPADLSADVKKQIESRKLVKRYAKSAMRDFKEFLGRFQYSPDWPMEAAKDFEEFIDAVGAAKKPSRVQPVPVRPPANNRLYAVSQLFEAEEIPNLPPYPPPTMADEKLGPVTDLFDAVVDELKETSIVCESVTYHPLLLESLHALLLCHCLVQTSPTEIRRHAYMVARLTRLCDGYPIFKVGHFPSRFDWNQVLSEAPFPPLVAAWADLCAPKCRAAQCKLIFDVSTTTAIEEKVKSRGANKEGVALAGLALGTLHTKYRNMLMQMSQDRINPDEILLREAFQPPGNRLEQQELPDALLNLATGTGHAGVVVRWLNEVPLVRMGRKKKTRRNVAARNDAEGAEVTVAPTAGQGGLARSETKQPEVTVVETALPIR